MQLVDYVVIFIGFVVTLMLFLVIGFIMYSVKQMNKQRDDFKVTTTYENPENLDEITIEETQDEKEPEIPKEEPSEKMEDVKEEETIEEIRDVPQVKEIDEEDQKKAEVEKELKKYPRKQRARLRKLYNDYQNGIILKVGENVDNAQYISERRKQWENS